MRIAVLLFSIFCAGVALADDDPCTLFGWDMARELSLLRGTPTELTALPQQTADARDTPLEHRIALKLALNSEVKLLTKPQHEPAADSYSGLLLLKVARGGSYRISTDQRLWVEVIGPDGPVKSSKFAMAPGCTQIHKSVAFSLQPGTAYWLQLSGSAAPDPMLLITLDR